MLIFGEKLTNAPVLSLQTGAELARTEHAIINPANLKVLAYSLSGRLLSDQTQTSYIRTAEIREYSPVGLIIDSDDEIITHDDIVTNKDIYELNFSPIGLKVKDEAGAKLGKVSGYTVNTSTYYILQLRVIKAGLSLLTNTDKLVHRSQIIEINNTEIIVKSTQKKIKDVTPIINTEPIINPFRSQAPSAQETSSLVSDRTS